MWKKCTSCKSPIDFGQVYWQCSVSTCQRKRTALYFCTVNCWDAHLATANHREAWAVEARAPSGDAWQRQQNEAASKAAPFPREASDGSRPAAMTRSAPSAPVQRRVVAAPEPGALELSSTDKDMLIVVSKLKKYIKERAGLKTSDGCAEVLSDFVRTLCDRAIQNAHRAERKTVLDRDFHGVL